jgi:thymidylate synthase
MNKIDAQYIALLQDILDNGVRKGDRTGTGTISVFGRQIRHRMSEGFPLITTKKMHWKSIVTELLWFLRGDTNIKYLVENGCHIWDGDAYKNYEKNSSGRKYVGSKCSLCNNISNHDTDYPSEHDINCIHCGKNDKWGHIYENTPSLSKEEFIERIKTDSEFANKWGNLGPIYGKQWRAWDRFIYDPYQRENKSTFRVEEVQTIDQIADAIHKLKTNPDDRGIIVSAWNVVELNQMALRPCHNFFQFYTRELSAKERLFFVNKSDDEYNKALSNEEQYKSIGLDFELALTSRMNELNIPTRAISLMWNQRSVDTPLGLPFNIASYALLLEIVGRMVNMVPDELIGNLGDTHIYLNQVEGINEQLTREPYELPSLRMGKTDDFFKSLSNDLSLITHLDVNDFVVENYKSHPAIKIPLSN